MPVMLGVHEMWVGVMLDSCFSVTYKINGSKLSQQIKNNQMSFFSINKMNLVNVL